MELTAEGTATSSAMIAQNASPVTLTVTTNNTTISKHATRSASTIWGLGSGITEDDAVITGCRLPSCRQVLRCMLFYMTRDQEGAVAQVGGQSGRSKWDAAQLVFSQVADFYKKANVPTLTERKCSEEIIALHCDFLKLKAIPINRRESTATITKLENWETRLEKTFQLWPKRNLVIKNAEDRAFLESMQTDRLATFGGMDMVMASAVKRRKIRDYQARKRQAKMQESENSTTTQAQLVSSEDEPEQPQLVSTANSSHRTNHHRSVRTGTAGFFPHNLMEQPKLVELATRLQMTPADQSVYTAAVVEVAGGDLSKVAVSYATTDRFRRQVGKDVAHGVKAQWVAPAFASLHWDSKLVSTLTNHNVTEERLSVVVGDSSQLKLLGVPQYLPGTDQGAGQIISNLTMDLLESWNCTQSIVNMTFDTTASNTGHLTAACVAIQMKLSRALLWSGCRHHIGEIILTHVFDDLSIEVSRSPNITLFQRFRSHYDMLPYNSSDRKLKPFDGVTLTEPGKQFLEQSRLNVLKVAGEKLQVCRDDYEEFLQVCVIFLGSPNEEDYKFRRPGAIHKARWMAKLLYSIKMCLLEEHINQLPPGTISSHQQMKKLLEFVIFATHIYSAWWFTCPSSVDAPYNDLNFYKQLINYSIVNVKVSQSAMKAMGRHLWYLTAEMVPLALFSVATPVDVKRALADRLLTLKPPHPVRVPADRFGMGFGKPKFPTITLTTSLCDLVSHDSWYIFHILKLDSSFLNERVDMWPESEAFILSASNVKSLNVINDCAERGVKLSEDFLASAKSEDHYQNVLQVVEHSRHKQPNLRKLNN